MVSIPLRFAKKNVSDNYASPDMPKGDFIILTAHRRENVGEGMKSIFAAVSEIASTEMIDVVYPVHKNEKIHPFVREAFSGNEYVKVIAPLRVWDFHNFLARCKFVITDSGGIQEEAAYLGKPILITRKVTERKELFTNIGVKLVGTDKNEIVLSAKRLIENEAFYRSASNPSLAFGDGSASVKIADIIERLPACSH